MAETQQTLAQMGARRAKLRAELAAQYPLIEAAAREALAAGRSESEVARDGNIDRMTVRKWAGKKPAKNLG